MRFNLEVQKMGCFFKAISDEKRRKILSILGKEDANAGEIASKFKISQPTVSNHLKILKEAGLIKERKVKQNRIYSLNKPKLQKVIETLQEISD
jgi:DNA-binding transcriptional ArsR family regulator